MSVVTGCGEPDVGERCADAQDGDRRDDQDRGQRVADEPRSLAGAARVAGGALVGTGVAASAATGARGRDDEADRGRGRRPRIPATRRSQATASTTHQIGAQRQRDHARRPSARRRRAWSRDGRPRAAASPPGPRAWTRSAAAAGPDAGWPRRRHRVTGMPHAIAWSTLLSCSIRSRTGVSRGRSAGTRSGTSAAVPSDSRETTTSPTSSASASMAIRSRPSTISNATAWRDVLERGPGLARAGLEPGPAVDQRPMVLVLELVLGVDPARDGDVACLAGPRDLERPRDGNHGRRREDPPDPRLVPDRAEQEPADPEQREADQDEDQGEHAGMIAAAADRPSGRHGAGNQRARRNLLDAWALM